VIIPASNAGDLMLRHDVVEACRAGKFRVWAVSTVGDALTLLTGREVGEPDADSNYAEGTLLGDAVVKATEYWVMSLQNPGSYFALDESDEAGGTEESTESSGVPT
jgi:hypothetical protein